MESKLGISKKDKMCRKNIPLFFKNTSRGIFKNVQCFFENIKCFFENNGYSKFPLRKVFLIDIIYIFIRMFFYKFKAILYTSQPFHQPSQF